jgi:hypothetical protein
MTEPDPATGDAGRRLDGNAAAGALREVFAVDLVVARCSCAHCGGTEVLGAHHLYADGPALVLRCPGCEGVVLRYGRTGATARLDLTGARLLVLDVPTGS